MGKLGIGIVGTGGRGIKAFGKILTGERYTDRVSLVALHDINPVRLNVAREELGPDLPCFEDLDSFLSVPGLDAVVITTPCHTHAAIALKVFAAGKHVFCEKTMGVTAEECYAMNSAAEAAGKVLQVGLCLRHADFMQELIPMIRRGDIGDVIQATAIETLEGSSHFGRWHRKRSLSGGILLQKGTHTLDILNWIVDDEPVAVSGFGGRDAFPAREECRGRRCLDCPEKKTCPEYRNIEDGGWDQRLYRDAEGEDGYIWDGCAYDPEADILDNANVLVEYKSGKRAVYTISLFFGVEGIERKITILGTRGKMEVSRRREEITLYRRRSQDVVHIKREGHGEGFHEQVEDFLAAVKTGSRPLADGTAGLWCALAGIAAETAIAEQRVVRISELAAR